MCRLLPVALMSKVRDWYWKIGGRGPDYYFHASFRRSDAEHLASLLRKHTPKGFRAYPKIINR